MCRHNQLLGCILLAFGLGVLIGIWINGGFFAHCFGVGMMVLGWFVIRRR